MGAGPSGVQSSKVRSSSASRRGTNPRLQRSAFRVALRLPAPFARTDRRTGRNVTNDMVVSPTENWSAVFTKNSVTGAQTVRPGCAQVGETSEYGCPPTMSAGRTGRAAGDTESKTFLAAWKVRGPYQRTGRDGYLR